MSKSNSLEVLKGKTLTSALPSISKIEKQIVCRCCNKSFVKVNGVKCYTNYGGTVRELLYCSPDCCDLAISINPERMSKMKSKIKSIMLW